MYPGPTPMPIATSAWAACVIASGTINTANIAKYFRYFMVNPLVQIPLSPTTHSLDLEAFSLFTSSECLLIQTPMAQKSFGNQSGRFQPSRLNSTTCGQRLQQAGGKVRSLSGHLFLIGASVPYQASVRYQGIASAMPKVPCCQNAPSGAGVKMLTIPSASWATDKAGDWIDPMTGRPTRG